jgi:hypothetical protein
VVQGIKLEVVVVEAGEDMVTISCHSFKGQFVYALLLPQDKMAKMTAGVVVTKRTDQNYGTTFLTVRQDTTNLGHRWIFQILQLLRFSFRRKQGQS